MILYGASGHGKVIIEILELCGVNVDYFVDANPRSGTLFDKRIIPSEEYEPLPDHEVIVSIGSNRIRKKISLELPTRFAHAIHPSSIITKRCSIGEGTVAMASVVVNSSSTIGRHVILNTSASIDHDCTVEDYAHISPNATLCGGVVVGEGAHIGAGATIIPQIKIGKWSVVGAGATIIRDVPEGAVVVGTPGRVISYRE